MDPTQRLPPPPVTMVVTAHDAAVAHWVFLIGITLAIAALAYTLREAQRSKSLILPLILLGGAFTNVMEPFVDITGGCWHPIIHQHRLFDIMGRPMPFWLLPAYIGYFGILTVFMYQNFLKGVSSRAMWLWFLVPVIGDILLEEGLFAASNSHLYTYYGNQPLLLGSFPMWWAPVNAAGVFAAALALALATPHLRGWRLAIIPFVTPLLYCGVGSLAGFPAAVVINSNLPYLVTQLGGIACFALSAGLVYLGTKLLAADSPWQIRDTLARQNPAAPAPAGYRGVATPART